MCHGWSRFHHLPDLENGAQTRSTIRKVRARPRRAGVFSCFRTGACGGPRAERVPKAKKQPNQPAFIGLHRPGFRQRRSACEDNRGPNKPDAANCGSRAIRISGKPCRQLPQHPLRAGYAAGGPRFSPRTTMSAAEPGSGRRSEPRPAESPSQTSSSCARLAGGPRSILETRTRGERAP